MKRVVGFVIFLCAVIAVFLIFSSSHKESVAPKNESVSSSPDGTKTIAETSAKARPHAVKADASAQLPPGMIAHSASDFEKGEMQNLKIVDGALQLGDDASFTPRFKPQYKTFGLYVSPEQSVGEDFDIIAPNFDVTPFEDNEVTFEFRTRSADGEWSTWYELTKEPGTQMSIEKAGAAWQYRLTFFANDPVKSPKVRSVSMTSKRREVQPDPGANFSASNGK